MGFSLLPGFRIIPPPPRRLPRSLSRKIYTYDDTQICPKTRINSTNSPPSPLYDNPPFPTRDPGGFVDGPNLYTYVVQNPWTKFDPLGLESNHAALEEAYQQQPKAIRWLVRGMVNALKTADDHMDRNEAAGKDRTMTAGQTTGVMLEGTAADLSIVTVAAAAPAGVAALGKEVVGEATGIPTDLGDLAKLAKNAPEGVADITKSARRQADETTEQVTRQTSSGFVSLNMECSRR